MVFLLEKISELLLGFCNLCTVICISDSASDEEIRPATTRESNHRASGRPHVTHSSVPPGYDGHTEHQLQHHML